MTKEIKLEFGKDSSGNERYGVRSLRLDNDGVTVEIYVEGLNKNDEKEYVTLNIGDFKYAGKVMNHLFREFDLDERIRFMNSDDTAVEYKATLFPRLEPGNSVTIPVKIRIDTSEVMRQLHEIEMKMKKEE